MALGGDTFLEQMVKKRKGTVDYLIYAGLAAGVIAAAIVGGYLTVYVMPTLGTVVIFLAMFGAWKVFAARSVEYEYSFTNGYVTVDKIINRSSRKRVMAFECSSAQDIGEYKKHEPRLRNGSFDHRVFAGEDDLHESSWFMVVRAQNMGKTLLVFDPNEKMIEAIKDAIPRQLKFELFGRN